VTTCDFCENEASSHFQCSRCENVHCSDHRLPENHDCPFQSIAKQGATKTRKHGFKVHNQEGSGVEAPEPLELSSNRSRETESTPTVDRPTESETDTTEPDEPPQNIRKEVWTVKATSYARSLVRLTGIFTLLLGAFNMFGTRLLDVDPVAPYRIFGVEVLQNGYGYYLGDAFVICLGLGILYLASR